MPMYFPDLKSVQTIAKVMARHSGDKKYTGLYPKSEKDLPKARKQLGEYFRTVWQDTIQALEIELAVTKENYDSKIRNSVLSQVWPYENIIRNK